MVILATTGLVLPKNLASSVFVKATTGSAVAALSGAEPQQFGEVTHMVLTGRPRAELVGEGAVKSPTDATFGPKVVTPHKFQVTIRANEEVQWADDDYQLSVLSTLADAGGVALARALDLGVFHGINPLSGLAAASIVAGDRIATTTNRVEITTATSTTPDTVIEQAAGLVVGTQYIPDGIAFDPGYAWTIATARYSDGRKKFPELGFGGNITSFQGLNAYSTTTVSGRPEAADTKVKAIIGQWDLLRWGVQKRLPVEIIRFGDPDGLGDLKRQNQIALRLEVVYGWGVLDLAGFAVVEDAVANV